MKKPTSPKSINLTKIHEIDVFQTMIASGPVIIRKTNGRLQTLLVKHGDLPPKKLKWKFCGGKLLKNWDLPANAVREAREEIGVKIKIIADLPTLALWQATPETGLEKPELIILVHYLAIISQSPKPAPEILALRWFDLDHLPHDSAPNVKPLIKAVKKILSNQKTPLSF